MKEHQGSIRTFAEKAVDRVTEAGPSKQAVHGIAETGGTPEATLYGAASFYPNLTPAAPCMRVCKGISCRMAGRRAVVQELGRMGIPFRDASCLGRCDAAPAAIENHRVITGLSPDHLGVSGETTPAETLQGSVVAHSDDEAQLPFNLLGSDHWDPALLERSRR